NQQIPTRSHWDIRFSTPPPGATLFQMPQRIPAHEGQLKRKNVQSKVRILLRIDFLYCRRGVFVADFLGELQRRTSW
ncbi:12349_t:CDS:2, partial [Gigaspora rosea]